MGGLEIKLHSLTSTVGGGDRSTSRPNRLTHGEKRFWYLLDWWLGELHVQSTRGEEEKCPVSFRFLSLLLSQ
jgi:hypothetical protein